ncbi:patatin-like phospholipase domain-containing protein [Coprinopsis cinerea okayama7|uniref:Patatin-like phospholipase domain-containing protein n=1 Tax=Coprinopsis cinerea (strain Okayama-7 / 130 / ATCC MYA-4618 / FGSC 9003) TaxID=240176 RepID=D6RMW8_COPC7|nr:patatin-like phospholipase domain-containing protein [Coprinopsis cinerea okayama7\|eukprot:XP_002911209.1 patatin-like phospholipase domain-containing protein [Coprinopsis cinerea okayama7\
MSSQLKGKSLCLRDLLEKDYVNEEHIAAFAHALQEDESYFDYVGDPHSPPGAATPQSTHSTRIRKVSALSDFAPINLKVKRSRTKKQFKQTGRHDWLFILLRWPLLIFIFTVIMAEFGLYVLIRQVVNTKEWITAWRGKKGHLRKKLRASRTYEEWKEAARELDAYLQFDEWKKIDEDPYYDWKLVRKVKRSLQTLREKEDARGCLGVLETCIRSNFAAVESPRLYSETYLGTKDLIESYFSELEKSIVFIRDSPHLSIDEKRRFFKSANANLGTTALCLSGGASFGYYHFGVVKAFFDAGLLPRVISGTSAGGLIAAFACCYTDEELKVMLVPELADKITACEESVTVWMKRFLKTGARFDSVAWARKCSFFTRGSMTFKEAYLRTGRILNISVIPADRHSPTKLLNYITAPDTVIWSTLLASAAVPGILNPVVIMQKLKDGTIVPWNWGSRFKDGSLRVDIPLQGLNLYFNVTNPVVSQVNPHVHLFFFAPRGSAGKPVAHRKGKGWRGNFLLSAAEQWLKHELTKNFKVIRDLELLPTLLGQDWSSVFLQRFDGAITIWPRTRDWIRILSDPDRPELERLLACGQIATWPKLHMIENRTRIEKAIFAGRQELRKILKKRASKTGTLGNGESRSTLLSVPSSSRQPPPTALKLPSQSSPSTSVERPLPPDTDAEAAFADGSSWFFKRGRRSRSESPPDGPDPLLSPAIRKKWASDLLDMPASGSDSASHQHSELRHTLNDSYQAVDPPPSPSIFARLRRNSLSFINGFRSRRGSEDEAEAWSSESSSGDDGWPGSRHHSRLHSPAPERRALIEDVDGQYNNIDPDDV